MYQSQWRPQHTFLLVVRLAPNTWRVRRSLLVVGGAGAAHVVVVLPERALDDAHAVHVEPLVAAAIALHPVHLLACTKTIRLLIRVRELKRSQSLHRTVREFVNFAECLHSPVTPRVTTSLHDFICKSQS